VFLLHGVFLLLRTFGFYPKLKLINLQVMSTSTAQSNPSLLSIVIPFLNEEEVIPQLVSRLQSASAEWSLDVEFILVDDGSTDRSVAILREAQENDPRFRIVKLSRNFGHQAAISAGLRQVRGAVVAIMDADLQDPPEELPRFLEKWKEGYQVIYAVRQNRKESWLKKLGYYGFYRILEWISEIRIPLDSGDFCVMDRKVVDTINRLPEQIRFVRGLRAFSGFRQIGVTYNRQERAAGEVKFTFKKLMQLALDGIFGFSVTPLRLGIWLGTFFIALSVLGALLLAVVGVSGQTLFWINPESISGFSWFGLGFFLVSGLVLLVLGIMGEYLGRIYLEVKKRPTYILEEVIEGGEKSE
jgi:glycosyltransferase involved in cell wall biosynthesis